jgi:colanic acid biosynthesis glycosyl transferase WcaI
MHALLVCPVYPPEPATSATTTQDLAEGLLHSGHTVTVITAFPNRPQGRIYAGYSRRFRQVEYPSPSLTVVRMFSTFAPAPTFLGRSMENLTFGLSTLLAPSFHRADVVYGNTWPLMASALLTAYCRLHKVPLVLNVQDIYPESAIGLGILSGEGKIVQWLRLLDAWIGRQTTYLVTLSQEFANFYREARKIPPEKIKIVSNWMDGEKIRPSPRVGRFRKSYGISPETFVVMYAGNVGAVAGVQNLIRTAALLKDEFRPTFVIAGDGSARPECETLARELGAENVKFVYPLPRSEVSDVQAAADLLVLPTQPAGALTSVPSKLISYMLSGRPVLAAVSPHSDTAHILKDAQAGIVIPPAAPAIMAIEIQNLMGKGHLLKKMGQKARIYAVKNFNKETCVQQLVKLLEMIAT